MFASLTLMAQDGAGGGIGPLMLPIMLVVLGYFFLFRPMQRQEKDRQAMVSALKKRDRVLTSGGVIATVDTIKDDEVSLKIDENSNVRMRVTKASIVRVLTADETKDKDTKEEG
jgi:preprotein translocase subunit YajC